MFHRSALFVALVLTFAFVRGAARAHADEPAKEQSRTFEFTYAGVVKDLKPGEEASIWLPVPPTTNEQEVKIVAKKLPAAEKIGQETQYGNKAIFLRAQANDKGEIPFEVTYWVKRREIRTDLKANLTVKPRADEPLKRFLEPDKMVPISGKPLELLKDKKLPLDQLAMAKQLYDLVNHHMKYNKEGKGWGRGDSVWACDSKFGNCTDFHSLFISMARGNKLASKFEMGFPIPAQRGQGAVPGYHCWAWFLPEGNGWIPVDISEANRFPFCTSGQSCPGGQFDPV
ncbi:MAG: transglutaminase domain-containing protein [Planctomycetes bacterium]|nr:transglutaminase domain-containing protein [Planctomycetota bacterium]